MSALECSGDPSYDWHMASRFIKILVQNIVTCGKQEVWDGLAMY